MANILIVEDEVIIALDIKRVIKNISNNTVAIATTCETAMEYMTNYPIDLVFMDINLKGSCKDGIEVVSQIRKTRDIHVIYITAYNDADTKRRLAETQAIAHITKPFRRDEIRNILKNMKTTC